MAHFYIKTLLLTICIRRVEAPSKDEFELVQTNQVLQTLINVSGKYKESFRPSRNLERLA